MAAFQSKTEMYTADKLVESAGTILFRLSTREVCVLHSLQHDEYVLPKGRRNLGESRQDTALRETIEETGVPCYLLPIDLVSRVCPTIGTEDVPDEPRLFKSSREPIAMQQRQIGDGEIKLIWWFVAAVDEKEVLRQYEKHKFEVEFHSYYEVLQKLTFEDDCELVKQAIHLVDAAIEHS
ncbi:NUDIX hydrolase domain-like protein [Trichoderma evansii]